MYKLFTFGLATFLSVSLAPASMISPGDVLASGATKTSFEKVVKDAKDTESVAAIKKAADGGDKDAQFTMAFLLQNGIGGGEKPDAIKLFTEAKDLYRKSGEAGQLASYNNLGLIRLLAGEDPTQAVADIQRAADRSYGKARISLAQLYLQGTGVEKNLDQSIRWLERAEEQEPLEAGHLIAQYMEATGNHAGAVEKLTAVSEKGYVPAMLYLGNKLLNATGVKQDIPTAQALFAKAEAAGDLNGVLSQGLVFEALGAAEKDETKRKEHLKKALEFFQKAADKKVPDGYNKLGYFYENGFGVEKSDAKALEFYKLGAEAKLPVSMFNYGVFLETGRGNSDKKDPTGLKWVFDSAQAGLAQAMVTLGERYRKGNGGLGQDPIAGMAWIEKAAKAGHMGAAMTLAGMLQSGEAGFQNLETAAKLYVEAVKKGEPLAAFQLAGLLEAGQGVPQDLVQAYALFGVAEAYLGKNKEVGDVVREKFAKVKEKLSTEQVKQGDEVLKKLMGGAAPAAPAPAASSSSPATTPAATPETKPKTGAKPDGKKSVK